MFRTISLALLALLASCKKDQLPVNLRSATRANTDQVNYWRSENVNCLFVAVRKNYNNETQRFEGAITRALFGDPARNMYLNLDPYNGGYKMHGANAPNVALSSVYYGPLQMTESGEKGDVHYVLETDADPTLPEVPLWTAGKNEKFKEMAHVINRGFPVIEGRWAGDTIIRINPDRGLVLNPWKMVSNCDSIAVGLVSDPDYKTEIRARIVARNTPVQLTKDELRAIRRYPQGYLFFAPSNYSSERVDGLECAFIAGLYIKVPVIIDTLQ